MSKIKELVDIHEKYRSHSLNLVASENILSQTALSVLASDLNGRYAADLYGGTRYIKMILEETENRIRELFKTEYASVKPVSGTVSVVATMLSFTKSGDKVAILHFKNGGFPLNIVAYDRKPVYLIYNSYEYNIDVDKSIELISKEKPKLVFLGASRILFPHPVKEISEVVHDYGGIVCYDGSHVLGLIAGGEFQDPLNEGADVLIGSTHKTFPGPQGGVFLTNEKDLYERFLLFLERPYTLVDNPHVARIAALGVTTEEMVKFGTDYAKSVVTNSRILAENLTKLGVKLIAEELGFTNSHQIILSEVYNGKDLKARMEKANIFIDIIGRIGTQEVTRRGMTQGEMKVIAEFIARVIGGESEEKIGNEVREFASKYNKVKFSFDDNRNVS